MCVGSAHHEAQLASAVVIAYDLDIALPDTCHPGLSGLRLGPSSGSVRSRHEPAAQRVFDSAERRMASQWPALVCCRGVVEERLGRTELPDLRFWEQEIEHVWPL